jgi:hypothetical protein
MTRINYPVSEVGGAITEIDNCWYGPGLLFPCLPLIVSCRILHIAGTEILLGCQGVLIIFLLIFISRIMEHLVI